MLCAVVRGHLICILLARRRLHRALQLLVDALTCCAKTGAVVATWALGAVKAVYGRFVNCAKNDAWPDLFRELKTDIYDTASFVDAPLTREAVGGRIQQDADRRSRGSFSTKVYVRASMRKRVRSTSRLRPGLRHEMIAAREHHLDHA